jgi:hypothetical protein
MEHYIELARYERNGFDIVVDMTGEYMHPNESFDGSVHDINEICRKIDEGFYDWFVLRARVLLDGYEFGSFSIGGMLYENPADTLTDGTAEDCIQEALAEAKVAVKKLRTRLEEFAV